MGILVGGAGGAGFSWLLQHLPTTVSWILAISASVTLGRMLWILHRAMRREEQELTELTAEIERVRQIWRAGSN